MSKVRTAVIGTGYLGKYHVEKFASLLQSELIAVCDIDPEHSRELCEKYHINATTNYRSLIGQIEAVSIVTPTPSHFEIGKFFLENGVHVLMEKPIATSVKEANDLIAIAKKNKLLLQVGHLERFNNVVKSIDPYLSLPRFIESERLAPFKLRGSEVNVVLDLMIHDIDIILSIVKSKITDIRANGASVLTEYIDIANARIEFESGCVASVTASRVSMTNARLLSVFQHDCILNLDLNRKKCRIHRKGTDEMFPGIPSIDREKKYFAKGDPLKEEIEAFLKSIITNTPPLVSGEDARDALAAAIQITHAVNHSNKKFPLPIAELV